jgi:ATP-dependent Clp protease ATP-binding subunit ClpA
MFERFTQPVREAVLAAQAEARALGHEAIGTEHLLLGVASGGSRAARVLAEAGATSEALQRVLREEAGPPMDAGALATLGIDLEEVRRRVEASFGEGALERGRSRPKDSFVPFTKRAKKALELALREAVAAGDREIGAEHVVLGLLRDPGTLAARMLERTCGDPGALRAALRPAAASRPERGG